MTNHPRSPRAKLTKDESNWLALYKQVTGFEAFDGELHDSFEERAEASIDWFQMWSDEAISKLKKRIPKKEATR